MFQHRCHIRFRCTLLPSIARFRRKYKRKKLCVPEGRHAQLWLRLEVVKKQGRGSALFLNGFCVGNGLLLGRRRRFLVADEVEGEGAAALGQRA